VDERAAAPLAADLAADDQLPPVRLLEEGFNGGVRLARANQISGGARAEQQRDGFDQNGFAGARLPRQHVEPGVELDLHGLDDRQVADAEETQHARGTTIVSYV